MLSPENWLNYSWELESGVGNVAPIVNRHWRVWQVSVIAGVGAATITFNGVDVVTIPAGAAWTGFPAGMFVGTIAVAGAPAGWTIEWIHQNQPT